MGTYFFDINQNLAFFTIFYFPQPKWDQINKILEEMIIIIYIQMSTYKSMKNIFRKRSIGIFNTVIDGT